MKPREYQTLTREEKCHKKDTHTDTQSKESEKKES